jgi:Flp pilus assembly protein protease CpaA
MSDHFFISLLIVTVFVSLYDLRYRAISNWITLPLILLGITIVNDRGNPALWAGSVFIFQAWKTGIIGGGDAKLWLGLLWCSFPFLGETTLLVMCLSLFATGLLQLIVRMLIQRKIETGIKSPGAWRTVVFMGFLIFLLPG